LDKRKKQPSSSSRRRESQTVRKSRTATPSRKKKPFNTTKGTAVSSSFNDGRQKDASTTADNNDLFSAFSLTTTETMPIFFDTDSNFFSLSQHETAGAREKDTTTATNSTIVSSFNNSSTAASSSLLRGSSSSPSFNIPTTTTTTINEESHNETRQSSSSSSRPIQQLSSRHHNNNQASTKKTTNEITDKSTKLVHLKTKVVIPNPTLIHNDDTKKNTKKSITNQIDGKHLLVDDAQKHVEEKQSSSSPPPPPPPRPMDKTSPVTVTPQREGGFLSTTTPMIDNRKKNKNNDTDDHDSMFKALPTNQWNAFGNNSRDTDDGFQMVWSNSPFTEQKSIKKKDTVYENVVLKMETKKQNMESSEFDDIDFQDPWSDENSTIMDLPTTTATAAGKKGTPHESTLKTQQPPPPPPPPPTIDQRKKSSSINTHNERKKQKEDEAITNKNNEVNNSDELLSSSSSSLEKSGDSTLFTFSEPAVGVITPCTQACTRVEEQKTICSKNMDNGVCGWNTFDDSMSAVDVSTIIPTDMDDSCDSSSLFNKIKPVSATASNENGGGGDKKQN